MTSKPLLTFFCELPEQALVSLFDDPSIISTLSKIDAHLSMGMMDLSAGRAGVVQRLNEAQIPVTAWLLLPKEDGYWFNINNVSKAVASYHAFHAWAQENNLHFEAIGLDIEPDRNELEQIIKDPGTGLSQLIRKLTNTENVLSAQSLYEQLVRDIKADGYQSEMYHIPMLVDERKLQSSLLLRLFGLLDVDVDREVLMLYSSFMSFGLFLSYLPEAQYVGVGITGGGVGEEMANITQPTLNWDELARDMRIAAQHTDRVYVFSLEGSVKRHFLPNFVDFDWSLPMEKPVEDIHNGKRIRTAIRSILWMSKYPVQIAGGIIALTLIIIGLLGRRKKSAP